MAARSNRSPSPLSSRPMNPNPRDSESNPAIRRSFSGHSTFPKPSFLTNPRRLDPSTPANSPSDFAARRSVGREGIASHLKECEVEKENDEKENVSRASKLQSPAKGCKNFMAPTISAASKFTPSPRKKVLVERNDPVRTSMSFSDGKAMFFSQESELKSELGSDSNLDDSKTKKAAVVEGHPVSKPCKKVTFSEIPSDESVVTDDSDSLNLESKVPPPPSSIVPLDADPSLPPYDPKTNYLSPRPQFIRYRPNPRVEILKNLDPNEFDDTLMAEIMSEGLSDTDEGTDESPDKDKEEMADMVIGMDAEIVEADARVSESLPASTTPVDEEVETVEINEKKPRGVLLSRLSFSLILLLLVACVSVSVRHAPPSFDQLLIKDLSFDGLSKIYEQSRVGLSLEGVARHVHQVSLKSVSLILKLVNEVVVEGEKQVVVPLKFMNLSDLEGNSWKEEGYFLKRVENLEYEEELDAEMEFEFEEDGYADGEEAAVEDEADADAFEEEEEYVYAEETVEEAVDSVVANEETVEEVAHSESEYEETVKEVAHSEPEYAAADSQTHQVEEAAAAMEVEKSQAHFNVGASDDVETSLSSPMAEATPAQVSSLGLAAVACSVFAAVAGASAFVYHYKGRSKERENGVTSSSSMSKKKAEQPIIHQEKEISERWETESEMSSSYQNRSYANKTMRKHSRRESLASSSGGSPSPSYGSFTTYERIPVKINGYGEDEIITPVRRSSRIRNQATSPV